MRIGAYQFAVSGNIYDNYNQIEKAIYLAKQKGVQLLIFPECSLTGYPPRNIINSSSVDFNLVHSLCDKLQSIADKNDISFIVGTIFKEKEIYNRALLFQPNTKIYLMTSVLYGDGIMIILQREIVMEYLKWMGLYLELEFVLKSDFLNFSENYTKRIQM